MIFQHFEDYKKTQLISHGMELDPAFKKVQKQISLLRWNPTLDFLGLLGLAFCALLLDLVLNRK
jgi:hypothetical protein